MGWDISIVVDTGGPNPLCADYDLNFTHNCNDMIRAALDAVGELEPLGENHLYALDGMSCGKVGDILERAISWWDQQPKEFFTKMEPENGWGDEKSARLFWSEVRDLCKAHPRATLRVDG